MPSSITKSFLPPRAVAPVTGQPVTPTERVASYRNQQLGNLTTGHSVTQGPTSPTLVALDKSKKAQSAVQLSAQRRIDSINTHNARMNQLGAVAVKRRGGSGGAQQGGSTVGSAYTPDGRLSASRNKVLSLASSYLGSPYVLGGTTRQGIDCSGLVMMVYNQLGYNITRHSATWQKNNIPGVRTSLANLRPGDIVAWKDGSHIAIYAGDGYIIEAANPKRGTLKRKLWANPNAVIGIALRLPGE